MTSCDIYIYVIKHRGTDKSESIRGKRTLAPNVGYRRRYSGLLNNCKQHNMLPAEEITFNTFLIFRDKLAVLQALASTLKRVSAFDNGIPFS